MIPQHVRVAAIDNVQDHLSKIYAGLAGAGYWVMPLLFDAGQLEPLPAAPNHGLRLIFSDIHLMEGRMHDMTVHANALLSCLKKIVGSGPYAIIFWTQYPGDAAEMIKAVEERASAVNVSLPIHFGCIDKNAVLAAGEDDEARAKLGALITAEVAKCGPLLLSISWEERVFQAAAKSTTRLFELATAKQQDQAAKLSSWIKLLGFLAKETVGKEAKLQPVKAMELALLPLLEDRLLNTSLATKHELQAVLKDHLGGRPAGVSASMLNGHYLLEALDADSGLSSTARGVVSVVDTDTWDEHFKPDFGKCWKELIKADFVFKDKVVDLPASMTPVLITLTPECDDVQGKVLSYRYLFGAMFKSSEFTLSNYYSKSKDKFNALSIFDVGTVAIESDGNFEDYRILISCSRFIAKSSLDLPGVVVRYRLRRAVVEELAHHYATHARRPGVMRFFGD